MVSENPDQPPSSSPPANSELTRNPSPEKSEVIAPDDPLAAVMPPDVLRRMPSHVRESMSTFIGPIQNPLTQKITETHITKALDFTSEEGRRRFVAVMTGTIVQAILVLAGLGVLVTLVVILKDSAETLRMVLTAVVSFLGGLGLGRVWGSKSS